MGEWKRRVYYYKDILPRDFHIKPVIAYDLLHQAARASSNSSDISLILAILKVVYFVIIRMIFVMCAIGPSKLTRLSITVKIKRQNVLILFIVIFGVLIIFHLFCGAHYCIRIVDSASRAVLMFLTEEKGEASQLIKHFYIMVNSIYSQYETN